MCSARLVPLATSTNSTAASEVYETLLNSFLNVGPLNNIREASGTAVVLPYNQDTLIAGGSHCYATILNNPKAIAASPTGLTESGNTVTVTSTTTDVANGYVVGQPVTITGAGVAGYNGTFTITQSAGTVATTKFQYFNPTSGLAASGGGTSALWVGPACGSTVSSGFECDALQTAELYHESSTLFTFAGSGNTGTAPEVLSTR